MTNAIDRLLPLISIGVGVISASVLIGLHGYRGNEIVVWSILAGSVLLAVFQAVWNHYFPPPFYELCATCGVSVSRAAVRCARCGAKVGWFGRRSVGRASESSVPAVRALAKSIETWVVLAQLALCVPVFLIWRYYGFGPLWFVGVIFLFSLGNRILMATRLRSLLRIRSILHENSGRACTRCLYIRDEDAPRCPECGLPETVIEAQTVWERSGLWLRRTVASDSTP